MKLWAYSNRIILTSTFYVVAMNMLIEENYELGLGPFLLLLSVCVHVQAGACMCVFVSMCMGEFMWVNEWV